MSYHNRRRRVGQLPQSLPLYVFKVEYGIINYERRSASPYSIVAVHPRPRIAVAYRRHDIVTSPQDLHRGMISG